MWRGIKYTYVFQYIISEINPFNQPLNPQNINKIFTWKSHHYFSFHASSKGPLKAPAMAECEAHALFVIHKTNLRFISYLNI